MQFCHPDVPQRRTCFCILITIITSRVVLQALQRNHLVVLEQTMKLFLPTSADPVPVQTMTLGDPAVPAHTALLWLLINHPGRDLCLNTAPVPSLASVPDPPWTVSARKPHLRCPCATHLTRTTQPCLLSPPVTTPTVLETPPLVIELTPDPEGQAAFRAPTRIRRVRTRSQTMAPRRQAATWLIPMICAMKSTTSSSRTSLSDSKMRVKTRAMKLA